MERVIGQYFVKDGAIMEHVSIEIIRKCPNKCQHCSSMSGMGCEEIMDVSLVKRVFDGLQKLDTNVVSISGGEPFLHQELVDIVRYGKEKGFKINIYTSGIMLDRHGKYISLNEEMVKQLKEFGLDKLIFNLQSLSEEVYNKIMGTEGNLKLLKHSIAISKKYGIYTELHFVPMKLNYKEIQAVVDYVENQGLDRVSFLGLIPHGRAKMNRQELYLENNMNQGVKKLLNKLECEKVRVGIPLKLESTSCLCNAGKEKMYIKFDGSVYGCEAFKYITLRNEEGNEIKPDSIYTYDIEYIYRNSDYLKKAKAEVDSILVNKSLHENCPIQEKLREYEA